MYYPEHCDTICTNCQMNKSGWCTWKDETIHKDVEIVSSTPKKVNVDFVDLGLPSGTLWATKNEGASFEENYGNYYYFEDAIKKFGASNIPDKEDFQELIDECTWCWVWPIKNKRAGYRVVGPNGNSILLPAAGYYLGEIVGGNEQGNYWTSQPNRRIHERGYILYFSKNQSITYTSYDTAQSIRLIKRQ